jgi:aminopeptidase N
MERASGQDLAPFFQQWLYRGGVPRIDATWTWDATSKQVTAVLTQTQAGEPFSVPIDVGINVAGTTARVERVELTGRTARFTFPADREPTSLVIDPGVKLLLAGRVVGAQLAGTP